MLPSSSPVTHSETDGHETALRKRPGSTVVFVQALAPPVGFVEVKTSAPVAATHSETEGHDTHSSLPPSGIDAVVQAPAPPVGSVDVRMVRMFGPPPPATHRETDGHEIAPSAGYPPIVAVVQALAPPLGSVAVSTLLQATAAHSEIDGQETPSPLDGYINAPPLFHAVDPPVGLVELRMLFAPSLLATHSDADGQEIATNPTGYGLAVSRQAANPLESSAKESNLSRIGCQFVTVWNSARGVVLPPPKS